MKYLSFGIKTPLVVLAIGSLMAMSAPALAYDRADFDGEFSSVLSSSPDCDDIFAEVSYHGLFQLTGPTRKTLVSNFRNESGAGFFHSQTFVSLFGYNNDFLYDKMITNAKGTYEVRAEGFVDYNVVYIEFEVTRIDVACTAKATYAGFN
jgi:hypothetical protein